MALTYTPSASDALFRNFAGRAFDDPIAYSAANNKRIDSKYFLKPIQDEVLNLIALALNGGGALAVRNETGGTLNAGPVRVTGYNAAQSSFLISAANATGAQAAQLLLTAALTNNTNGTAYVGGTLSGALNTSGAAVGDPIYLAVGGGLTLTAPAGADEITQRVGRVKTIASSGDVSGLIEAPIAFGTSFLKNSAVTNGKLADGSVSPVKLDNTATDSGLCEGRLTTEATVPVSSSDRLAQTSLYFTPCRGSRVSLYDGSRWKVHAFSEIQLALSSLNPGGIYDVFAYDNAGSVALETLQWTNTSAAITAASGSGVVIQVTSNGHGLSNGDRVWIHGMNGNTAGNDKRWCVQNATANTFELAGSTGNGTYTSGGTWRKMNVSRATSLTLQDGVPCKTGALTRRYIGSFVATAANQTEDSAQRRFVWNMYNAHRRPLRVLESTDSWTYSSATVRPLNNSGANSIDVLIGYAQSMVMLDAFVLANSSTAGSTPAAGIGENSTSVLTVPGQIGMYNTIAVANQAQPFWSRLTRFPAAGAHFYQLLERGGSGTCTWFGDAGISDRLQSGMDGFIEA
ncbi:MAG TPA: hypothetical protein VEJ63_08930 [Planctomycetota bacterium]|nr:hypothetical protein [Planctomycetota bacterium]